MASQLVNEHCYIKHCWSVYEQHNIVNSVRVDDWRAELTIIPGIIFAGRTLTGPSGSLEETAKKVISPVLFERMLSPGLHRSSVFYRRPKNWVLAN